MKLTRREFLWNGVGAAGVVGASLLWSRLGLSDPKPTTPAHRFPVVKTDAEWKKILTPAQYHILREAGTDPPFSGQYEAKGKGIYDCVACDNPLYSTDTQFDSGTGWPSFWQPLTKSSVWTQNDSSFGMDRTEVVCARCGGHLGHVFNDGPKPTGLRYCMNATALKFVKK
jgi:peptide-methionine (R)-S-oxide reductase